MESSLVFSSKPRSIAIADLNNDHLLDIVVANSGTNTIGIFLSQGQGNFHPQMTFSTGSNALPYSITIADFNNDTYLDIAVGNYGLNNIEIFSGDGNGSFVNFTTISLASSRPLFITTADFNNDTQIDIAVVNYGTNTLGILLANGNASFQNHQTYSTGDDSFPSSLVVADFNDDSHLDIAVASSGTDSIGIFLGVGNGSFENQRIYSIPAGSDPSSISAADFNDDGHFDLVVSNNGTGSLGLFYGNGNGTFQQQELYSTGPNSHPQSVVVGDLNGDHHVDIVLADAINDQIHVIRGLGNGNFDVISTYDGISESAPFSLVLADINQNNQTDIVAANFGLNNVLVLIDYFVEPSARKTILFTASLSSIGPVATGDFNDDHIPDVVFSADDIIHVFTGLANGSFVENPYFSLDFKATHQYICVGDLNNDNRTDIIAANTITSTIDIFLGYGNETLPQMLNYSTGKNSQPWWLGLGDFNGDHVLDIVSANQQSRSMGIFLGYGNGSFAPMVPYPMASDYKPQSVAVGYIDGDNYLDCVVSDDGGTITVFAGFGNGTFYMKTMFEITIPSLLFSIALADFNDDNHLDIVVSDTDGWAIVVLFGYGNGTFDSGTGYCTGISSSPYYVIVNDFNNDHINDIATTNQGTNEILIFFGYGNGSFELARNYSTGDGSKPYGITAADLDNNKQLEIVAAFLGTKQVAIFTEYEKARFSTTGTLATGSAAQPYAVTVGRFGLDGKPLIVTANSGTDEISILFSSTDQTFDTEVTRSTGSNSQPKYVLTADINSDQRLDIVSVNSKSDSVSILLGNDNGTFDKQIVYSTGAGSKPYAAVANDLNNDTRLDLVIAYAGTDQIGIFYGLNFTAFQPFTSYANQINGTPGAVVVSDFNADSHMDMAVVLLDTESIGVLLGDGHGSFAGITTFSTGNGSYPYYLAVGDFNQDNKTDIAVVNQGYKGIGIFLGHGGGSFAPMRSYSAGEKGTPRSMAIGDLDDDGQLDIVVVNSGGNNIGVLLGDGNGSFSGVQLHSTGNDSLPTSAAIADMNHDNRSDIVVSNRNSDSIGIFFGYGNGTFRDQAPIAVGFASRPNWLTIADFNLDHQLDVAVALWNGNRLQILFGPVVNGSFADNISYPTGAGSLPLFVCTNDFNGDTYLDLGVVNFGSDNIMLLFGLGDGTFLRGKPYSTGINSSPYAMAVADFNHDCRLDIVVVAPDVQNTIVFLASENEPFGIVRTISTSPGSQPHSVVVGDCNNDGQMDIVVANYGTNNVGVLLGYPKRRFSPMMTYSTGPRSSPYSLALADLNNDRNLDIAVSNSQSNTIMIMFGIGNGSFIEGMIYSSGERSRPYSIVLQDMNNDHLLDIVVANSGTSNILLLYGLGNGTFGNASSYDLGYSYEPYSAAVSDLNGDYQMDIVVACHGTDHVEIFLRRC